MFLPDGCIIMDRMKAIRDDISIRTIPDAVAIHPLRISSIPPSFRAPDDRSTRRRSTRRADLRRAKDLALDIMTEALWPTRCAICDEPGYVVCSDCAHRIHYIDILSSCPKCGSPYGSIQCSECNEVAIGAIGSGSFPFNKLASAVHIDEDTKRLITVYKDHDEHRLAPMIARTMVRYIDPSWVESRERTEDERLCITFIPSTVEALNRRGFDHMERVSALISSYTHLPIVRAFERPKSEDQRKLTRRERVENMKRRFNIRADVELPSRLIVVDDICTTGSTLFSAALSLREHGCKDLYGLTFGKVC